MSDRERLVLVDGEVRGAQCSVAISDGLVVEVSPAIRPRVKDTVIDCAGGAVIPGLWDHHVHLLAMAEAARSVQLGPPDVTTPEQFVTAIRAATASGGPAEEVRGVGYHESVAGDLSRSDLDAVVADRPVRVQHRSGALWILNTPALVLAGVASETGRIVGNDELLRSRAPERTPPRLAQIGKRLAGFGVTGVTDATPSGALSSVELLASAVQNEELQQRLVVTGGLPLAHAPEVPGVSWGPVKIVIADHSLPDPDDLAESIRHAHEAGRSVAVHSVSPVSLALALGAFADAGVRQGDRVEHGSVISDAAADRLADFGVTIVTQPGFVAARGDDYLADIPARHHRDLYRCATLLARGIPVGGSTDAPFGPCDPWVAIRGAMERLAPSGRHVGRREALRPARALELFLGSPATPGGPPRRIAPGCPADLCVLDLPLSVALREPHRRNVRATLIRGRIAFARDC